MRDVRLAALSRRRFLALAALALAAPTLGVRSAAAAGDTWVQNFQETDLWTKASGGKVADRAPQWSYFKVLGAQSGARIPVEHPLTKATVYIEAVTVGPSGAPDPSWAFVPVNTTASSTPPAAAPAAPATPATAAPPPPTSAPGAVAGGWVSVLEATGLWTAPTGGLILGMADPGQAFKVLEQKGARLRVQEPFTEGQAYLDAKAVGAIGQPATIPVPSRWFGYVGGDDINVRSAPNGDAGSLGTLGRGTPVGVASWVDGQEVLNDQPGWARLADGVFVYGPLLRKAQIATPPPMPSHGPLADKWIDVNLTQQTVTAYEGKQPVYMGLTSSGRPGWETHEGVHEILWRKESETMDSSTLVGQDAARASYKIENIRWTQYFSSDGQAIHENFWRDPALFGIPSSHGCLGMAGQDSLWFWLWAGVGTPLSIHS